MVHRILHGHKPVWYQAPISDYLTWRICRICKDIPEEQTRPDWWEEAASGNGFTVPPNYHQIIRSPFD